MNWYRKIKIARRNDFEIIAKNITSYILNEFKKHPHDLGYSISSWQLLNNNIIDKSLIKNNKIFDFLNAIFVQYHIRKTDKNKPKILVGGKVKL